MSASATLSKEQVRSWLEDPTQWPNDSYNVETLEPSDVQARRETQLREILPAWCWDAEAGASVLSIGTGKGYFERKHWQKFHRIYVIDPSDNTRASLSHFPIPNAQFLGTSLFNVSIHLESVPKYAWLGACIHYLFGEFHGWEFMWKLAMTVSDTIVVDAGVFDPETRHGATFAESWKGDEVFEVYRSAEFSYAAFLEKIRGLWEVEGEWPTPWIDGRRTVVLKRVLPPIIQRSELGELTTVKKSPYWSVHRTKEGYFKETDKMTQLLAYDTVSKVMGWDGFLRWRVFDGDRYCGFITRDCGDRLPPDAVFSERMHLGLSSWLLPLGLVASDLARQNLRVVDGRTVWIDVDLRGLRDLRARDALWLVTNLYKQYQTIPRDVHGVARARFGTLKSRSAVDSPSLALAAEAEAERIQVEAARAAIQESVPERATLLVVSRGDDRLVELNGRTAWHFPRSEEGWFAGSYPADDEEAIQLLESEHGRGAGFIVFPADSLWWLEHYHAFAAHLHEHYRTVRSDKSCIIFSLAPLSPEEERLREALHARRADASSPHEVFGAIDDAYWFWLNTEGCRRSEALQRLLPSLPDAQTQAGIIGSAGDVALREGYNAYCLFKRLYEQHRGPLNGDTRILDFGCGWGRIIRFFLKDMPPAQLVGADYSVRLLEVCRNTNSWCEFVQTQGDPPSTLPAESFDLIYLYSVFSHLSEESQTAWRTEFHRLLKPGGLLIATTWHRGFIEQCHTLRTDPAAECESAWRETLANVFVETERHLADYDSGAFVFAAYDREKNPWSYSGDVARYGEACVPRAYVERHWSPDFELVAFIDDRAQCPQNVIVARKSGTPRNAVASTKRKRK